MLLGMGLLGGIGVLAPQALLNITIRDTRRSDQLRRFLFASAVRWQKPESTMGSCIKGGLPKYSFCHVRHGGFVLWRIERSRLPSRSFMPKVWRHL